MLVQMSWYTGSLDIISDKQNPRNIWTINIFMHLTTESHLSWGFPTKSSSEATAFVVLHIHGRLRLQEPLDHGIVAVGGCHVQRCVASGAAARGQATGRTQQNELRKTLRQFWCLESQSFENCGHSKILPELKEHCGFDRFWWHQFDWKNCCLWFFGSQDVMDNKPKHIPTHEQSPTQKSLFHPISTNHIEV